MCLLKRISWHFRLNIIFVLGCFLKESFSSMEWCGCYIELHIEFVTSILRLFQLYIVLLSLGLCQFKSGHDLACPI